MTKKRILFAGYAPVHFLCYLPMYQRLQNDPDIELFLTGGFRTKVDEEHVYNLEGFYDPYPVDHSKILSVERMKQEAFDVVVCAHTGDTLFPKSFGKSVEIFHGVSFRNLSIREKVLAFDYLCIAGRYHAEAFRSQGLIQKDRCHYLLTGFPKTDALVSPGFDRDALLRELKLDPKRPTLLFAPTGEKHNALESMGHEVIDAVDAYGAWNLLIKPHDHPKNKIDWFNELASKENDRVRIIRSMDIVPFMRASDLLMTDASSVAVEYTLLDRPIVFFDVPKLFKRTHKRAPALDLDTYGRKIGVIIKKKDDIAARIKDALVVHGDEVTLRRKMAEHVFYKPGGCVTRIAEVIRHAAGLTDALPKDVEVLVA